MGMHELTSLSVSKLDSLFRKVARAWEDLCSSLEIDDYGAFRDCAAAIEALEASAGHLCRALTAISPDSRRERDALLRRVESTDWPGFAQVLKREASEHVCCLNRGWAVSLEHGAPFWIDEDDIVPAAAKGLSAEIWDQWMFQLQDQGCPEPPDCPEVDDHEAMAWFMDRIHPVEKPFEWARRLCED